MCDYILKQKNYHNLKGIIYNFKGKVVEARSHCIVHVYLELNDSPASAS